jgi:regulatory protein
VVRRRPTPGEPPAAPASSPRATALRLLGRRDYTTAELRSRLLDRGFTVAAVDATLSALSAERLVDDRRTALAHIRTGSQIKGRGRLRLRRELQARGVDADLSEALLADLDEADEIETAIRVLERKHVPGRLTMDARRRIFQQLLRRGFPSHVIAQALAHRANEA